MNKFILIRNIVIGVGMLIIIVIFLKYEKLTDIFEGVQGLMASIGICSYPSEMLKPETLELVNKSIHEYSKNCFADSIELISENNSKYVGIAYLNSGKQLSFTVVASEGKILFQPDNKISINLLCK